MHKKILRSVSIVLTAALLFSILTCAPFSVGAAEADGVGAVAADVFDYFGELSNGRYTLESQTYALTEDFLAEGYLYVPSGVEATIDLNGKTLKRALSSASANGSVIKNEGTLTISDSSGSNAGIITGGYAEQGGAVNNLGELTINGGTIEKNKGSSQAGAVYNTAGATLTVNGGVIRQNISGTYGGGAVVNSGTMTVTGGAFTNNEAAMNGGAIWNGDSATLTLKGGSITGNVAGDRGSGIFNRYDGTIYAEGAPVVKDNAGGNLFLNDSRLSFSGSLSADAQIDISTDLSGSVTSSFVGDVRGVTFANGHTAAKLENGELVPDLGDPTMVSTWAELENAVNNAQGEVSLALANDIVNTELHQRLRVPSGTNANVTIDLCGHTIDVNRADQGSADQGYFMWVDHGAAATVKDSRGGGVITGGNATGTTGGIHVSPDATLNLYNVRLNNNKSSQYGGAIFNCGALTVESSVIANNTADARGGAMYIEKDSTSVSITGTRITGNKAGSRGGAIYQYANDNKITSVFTDCFITGNTQSNNSEVDSGGAIFLESGNITMNGGSVCGNSGNDAGAAMIFGGTTFKATGTRFNSNESRNYGSGAFSNAGTLELTDCQVNNNTSHGEGAAFHNRGTATVTNSELNGNTSGAAGGAIYILTGSVKLTDSTLSGNRANNGNGGAIHSQNGTNLKIFGCHITNNTCTKSGGGMYIINGGFTEIYDSEFTGNTADENGGGIYLSSKTQLNVVDSTVSGNTATSYAGGIFINDESESKLVVRGLLNFSGNKLNTGAASNVYLTSSKTIEIYWHPELGLGLDPASQIGITAANYNRKLTTSLRAADESDLAPFTLDSEGESYGFVKSVSDGELYVKKIDKTSVNSWDGLQNAINNGNYEKYITLSDNITASGSQTRIRIYDGDTVTIDLNGKKLNRGRSSKDRDGHVIEVKGGGRLTVVDSVGGGMITGGYANNGGGVNINEGGSFIFESGQISGNKADDGGGVYVHDSAAFTMKRDAVVTENTASDEGGGVFFDSPETITGGRITKNTAKYGGAVYFDDSDHTLSLSNVTMRDNTSTYRGGAVYVWHGTVELVSCTVSNNTAKDGGAAYITSKCTLDAKQNTRFESNKSTDAGGGAIVNMETLKLNGCTFTGNTAKYNGGAVYSNKNAAITNCTFTRNTSTDANGGAVFVNDGNVTLESCTIRENIAAARGCGVFVYNDADSFNVKGAMVITGNGTNDVYLKNGKKINISGALSVTAKIGVSMESISGTFTTGYRANHGAEDPALYFTPDLTYSVILDNSGEAMVIESDWTMLRKQFENAQTYELITLQKDWSAINGDEQLTVAAGKNITLDLNGHTIDGKTKVGNVIVVNGSLTIIDSSGGKGVITGGKAANGGAILNKGTLTISGGVLSGNDATNGGAVYNEGTFTLDGGTIKDNTATNGAAIYQKSGVLTIAGGSVKDNRASTNGGAVYLDNGSVNLMGGVVSGNTAVREGGGVFVSENTGAAINAGSGPVVQENSAPIGNNILLSSGKSLNLTSAVHAGARLDIVTKNTSFALTSGYERTHSSWDAFRYNGSAVYLKTSGGELWFRETEGGTAVNSWDELQSAIYNSYENQVIVLKSNLDGRDKSCLNVSSKTITIDLNGHIIDRHLSDDKDDGEVLDVTGSSVLTIEDRAGTGVITGGSNDDSGGGISISNNATCIIKGGSVQGNYSDSDGGGISVSGTLIMEGGAIGFNTSDVDGGGIYSTSSSTVRLDGALITGNTSDNGGGGLYLHGNDPSIKNCVISNNRAKDEIGGGIFFKEAGKTLTIEGTRIIGNTAKQDGGGIYLSEGTVELYGSAVSSNTARNGGGVLTLGYMLKAENTDFDNNYAENGGGIASGHLVELTSCNIRNNVSKENGAGLFMSGNVNRKQLITDTVIEGNSAYVNKEEGGNGGGIFIKNTSVEFTRGSISYNTSRKSGGGVYADAKHGSFVAIDTHIDHNQTVRAQEQVDGGGIFLKSGLAEIKGGSVSYNFAKYNGGGIYVEDSAKMYLQAGTDGELCVLEHNDCDLRGGAVHMYEDGYLFLQGCIIRENDCENEAIFGSDDVYIEGTVITENNKGADVFMEDDCDFLIVTGKIKEGTRVGVKLSWHTGTLTQNYPKHNTEAPEKFFYSNEEGYGIGLAGNGEATVRSTEWVSMQNLIDSTASGGTVTLQRNYKADGNDTSLRIPKDKTLTLDLNGFTLDGGNAIGVLRVENGGKLTVKDSVGTGGITGGKAGEGGAVNNLGTLNIESGHFYGNTADQGGAVRNTGTLTVSGGKFDGNTASYDGGAIWNSGTLTVNSGVFEENDAKRNGGAVWNSGEANLLGGSVTKNNAGSGGGFFCASGGLNVKNAPVVFGNTAAAGKNILLSEGNAVKLTEALTDGAKLDLSTQDINSPLTNGFGASSTERSVFTYNEDSSVTLEVKNSELYYPKDAKFPDVNVWVSGWTELQNTINNVQNGSVIALNANLGAAGQKRIVVDSKKVTLELAGHVMDRHLTDDEDTGNVFKITDPDAELTIRDTVGSGMITGGYADDDGGGIFIANGATCIIESGVICGNRAESDGGGISVDDGKLIMRGGAVINNIADDTAGGIYCDNDGTFEITGATISGNLAENDGGGLNIHLSADATIENSFIINNNSRTEDGGGLRMSASDRTLKLINTAIDGNSAENEGGGVTVDHGNVEMTGGSLSGNRSENGAGVYVNGDTGFTAKEGAVISNNTSTKYGGGGITCYGDLSLTGVTVSGNSAKRNGGGIYYKNSGDNASLTNVIIRNNSNESQGGGIYLQAGTITMTNGEVSNNSCTDGGGVYVTEDTDFYATGVTFDSNEATESAGGAMVTKGDDVTLTRCTVTNNITKHNGGGVYTSGDKLTLDSCTFTGNKSRSSSGGGVYAAEDDLYLKGSNTFTENDAADNGAAIFVTEDATIYVQGTPVIRDNFGTSIYIDSGDRIHLNGALNAGSRLGVTLRNEFGAFTDGFNRYHSGGDPADFFFSDYGYEIYKTDNGEAALRWMLEEDNGFIDRNNNIVDSNKVNGNNWMSAVSGERTINELNLVRAHDAAMNDVSGNLSSSKVKTLLATGVIVFVLAAFFSVVPFVNFAAYTAFVAVSAIALIVFAVLHTTGLACAKTQYLYLDEMMEAGVRVFDLRLNNKNWEDNDPESNDDNENLWLCHGEDPTAGCFYGEDHDDNTLSLDTMLTWSKEFLKKHPTETFLLEFSLETQDNVGYEEVVYTRLKNILKNFSYEINPSTGKPYLYLEDGEFGKYYTYWPKLKDVRGQILFRVTSEPEYSYYHKMLGGYQSTMDGKTPYYTRATADGGDSVVTPTDTILAANNSVDNHPLPMILKDALVHRNINSGTFVNTTDDPMRFLKDFPNLTTPPCELEEDVYNGTDDAKGLLTEGSSFVEKGLYHGIFGGDALTWGRIRTLWSTNFYDGFEYCTVKVKTGIEGDQQEKTYKVLKGTTITIPGSIYDNPYNGQGYFQNWKAETGDTYDWAPNYSLQDDLGFDHTRTELQSNRDWLLAQSEVVQIDPATQIAKNSTRVVEPGEQITIMDNTEFTAQWGAEPHTPIDVVWVDGDDAEGVRPEKLTVSYKTTDAAGAEVVNTATVDAQSQWKTIVEALPTEAPTVIDWNDLTGVEATGYRCEVTEKPGIGYTITLYHHPQNEVEVKGTVSWKDNDNEKNVRPESVTVYLLKDGVKVGSKTVTAADNWQYSFGTLKEFVKPDGSASYERNVYSVTEEPLRCYDAGIDDFDITNVLYIPDQSIITTEIRWRDGANSYGERPDKITLHLYDGSTKIASQEVAVADYGTMTFAYFDVTEYEQENLGKDFDYRIEQDAIEKYAVKAGSYKRDNDVIGYANEYDNTGKYFKGHSLTLNGDVNVNFYIALTPEQARNATVSFAWFDKELSDVTLSASNYDSTKGYYKVICPVAVAEMTYDIIATLKLNGEEVEINRYAVASYAEVILLDNEFAQSYIDANGEDKYNQLCDLMWAMLDYGGKAQKRFDRNLGNLANGGYSVLSDPVTPDMITTVPDDLTQGLAAYGLEYGYSSVVFLSGASLRHFYRVTDETLFNKVKDSVKFTDNEKPDQVKEYAATPISRGGYVYFEMKDIPASKLDYQYQLQIGESSYKFSVMDSVKVLMESDPDDKTLELCKATYRYNQAANKFFGY